MRSCAWWGEAGRPCGAALWANTWADARADHAGRCCASPFLTRIQRRWPIPHVDLTVARGLLDDTDSRWICERQPLPVDGLDRP
jgi:hypothetical protein